MVSSCDDQAVGDELELAIDPLSLPVQVDTVCANGGCGTDGLISFTVEFDEDAVLPGETEVELLQYRIDSIAMAFYEIAILADFERRAHQLVETGQPVNLEVLQNLYLDCYTTLYGDAMSVPPNEVHNAWMTWVHLFFDRPFYVFQYATSLAASTALHAQVVEGSVEDRSSAVERYLEMLRSGASADPVQLLRRAGVDLTDPNSLRALVDEMDRLVTRLEVELEKTR